MSVARRSSGRSTVAQPAAADEQTVQNSQRSSVVPTRV